MKDDEIESLTQRVDHQIHVDENHRVESLTQRVDHQIYVDENYRVESLTQRVDHHNISKLSTSHTMFATSIFVITKLSNQEY